MCSRGLMFKFAEGGFLTRGGRFPAQLKSADFHKRILRFIGAI